MSDSDSVHREACRRFHRMMAHYFAVYAWQHDVDCVAIGRASIERLFQISGVRSARRGWMEEDMRPWFPYMQMLNLAGKSGTFHSLYLSRKPLPGEAFKGNIQEFANFYTSRNVRTVVFTAAPGKDSEMIEREILGAMALIAAGLLPLSGLPGSG